AVRFFYMQRCGQNLPEELAGKWAHPTCHTELATIYGTDKKIDVSGGWHDAGDYGRYVVASSKAIADLLSAYRDNKEAFG
ncbi:glycoside hydrolase family 9 protein, partial [Klebsiella pneumoniae]|uniref:glycoside hydrolase family 9 protein n=1 Tax=Klebsiella pneumoniae TaxID=573 RepID=UPI003013676D